MRDITKTTVKRQQSSKRQHRRNRNHMLYALLVVLLIFGLGLTLSATLFFNIESVQVITEQGTVLEDMQQEIADLSGIHPQDNLVRLDAKAAENRILENLVYARTCEVKKKFPSTVIITVTTEEPVASISCSYGYLIVSATGKILEFNDAPDPNLLLVTGFNLAEPKVGQPLHSESVVMEDNLRNITAAVAAAGNSLVRSINLSSLMNIVVQIGDNITFEMGSSDEATYKLKLALEIAGQLPGGKQYRMTMIGGNQISVITLDTPMEPSEPGTTTTTLPVETTTTTTTTTAAISTE